jgi:N-formylglutamate deformylase
MKDWLEVRRGSAPVVVSFPHTGTTVPADIETRLVSPWLARKDTDWWVHELYDFAAALGITTVRTAISRTVIDVNRDPSGKSLYPGANTTDLCPITTFDGEALYLPELNPDKAEIDRRLETWFTPYHAALRAELDRLAALHPRVVLYDAHSIRSRIPRLFDGELPQFNIGTNRGASCSSDLTEAVEAMCALSGFTVWTDGRFKGGWITRHYGEPRRHVHAIQMELACRGYLREPADPLTTDNWPVPLDPVHAAPLRGALERVLEACIVFGSTTEGVE